MVGLRTMTVVNRQLFTMKLLALCIGTALFVPLVYVKLRMPAYLYAGGLLALHAYFLYLYFSRVSWRQLLHYRATFTVRVTAVAFFIYMLSLLHFGGTPAQIIGNLFIAFAIHFGILLGLMLVPQSHTGDDMRLTSSKASTKTTNSMIE